MKSQYDGLKDGSDGVEIRLLAFVQQWSSSPFLESVSIGIRWNYRSVVVYFVHYLKCVRSTQLNKYKEIEENSNYMLHTQGKIGTLYLHVNNFKSYHCTNKS